jgi:hypothetical protein
VFGVQRARHLGINDLVTFIGQPGAVGFSDTPPNGLMLQKWAVREFWPTLTHSRFAPESGKGYRLGEVAAYLAKAAIRVA